jgi:hypothetical protein
VDGMSEVACLHARIAETLRRLALLAEKRS